MKTIAFFGDSFVAKNEGWIEYFCKKENYQVRHIGKTGSDVIYPFEKWLEVNSSKEVIDVCVYCHTSASRLYHPDYDVPLTEGVVEGVHKNIFTTKYKKESSVMQAAQNYYLYLDFATANEIKSVIIPMGIDRYMKEHNTTFLKIIHLWSFAPNRYGQKETKNVHWPFELVSGVNVKLDLSNLSSVEPGKIKEDFDSRPLHFSPFAYTFMSDLLSLAINSDEKPVIDFSFLSEDSRWDDYQEVLEKYKNITQ